MQFFSHNISKIMAGMLISIPLSVNHPERYVLGYHLFINSLWKPDLIHSYRIYILLVYVLSRTCFENVNSHFQLWEVTGQDALLVCLKYVSSVSQRSLAFSGTFILPTNSWFLPFYQGPIICIFFSTTIVVYVSPLVLVSSCLASFSSVFT